MTRPALDDAAQPTVDTRTARQQLADRDRRWRERGWREDGARPGDRAGWGLNPQD